MIRCSTKRKVTDNHTLIRWWQKKMPHEKFSTSSGHPPTYRELTQSQNVIRQLSRGTTLSILENANKQTSKYYDTSINRLVELIAGIASQQRPTTSANLKPASTNTLSLGGKSEKVELFGHLFHTMLKMQDRGKKNQSFSCLFENRGNTNKSQSISKGN